MRTRTPHHPLRGPASTLSDIISYGYFNQVRLLISSGLDIESRDTCRRTPIILCAFMEPKEWGHSLAMTLIEHGARIAHRDRYGRNALHYACIYERARLVDVLLRAVDYDLNKADKEGNTALHYAAITGNVAVMKSLTGSYGKYKLDFTEVNAQGRTALDEAYHCGHGACAQVIEQELMGRRPQSTAKDVRFADDSVSDHLDPDTTHRGRCRSAYVRPMSAVAFLTRRDSNSSLTTTDDQKFSYKSRSNLSLPSGYYRKSQNPMYARGFKNDEEIIQCAGEQDFRNNPDYVFKLAHLTYDPEEWESGTTLDSINRHCNSVSNSRQSLRPRDWRGQLKLLFKVYENQCSTSWRASGKFELSTSTVEHDPSCTGPEIPTEDKNKKSRTISRSTSKEIHMPEMKGLQVKNCLKSSNHS